jgi:8-oxo-dGTP diphosphatase
VPLRVGEEIQAVSWEAELSRDVRRIHVLAGVLEDAEARVLVAQRPPGRFLAGAWEFPGGKIHPGEAREAALGRELLEELGIRVRAVRPLIRYLHRYPDLEVDLDAWRVLEWDGAPRGLEGQAIDWWPAGALLDAGLLPADAAIAGALRLPEVLLVTPPEAPRGEGEFLDALEEAADSGRAGMVCLRRPDLEPLALLELAAGAACRLEGSGLKLLLHGDPGLLAPLLRDPPPRLAARLAGGIAGLHVPGRFLHSLAVRPVAAGQVFGTSCHDAKQLGLARALGADYAVLGAVKPTASHPGEPGMGWTAFAALVAEIALPVYAIGGLSPADLDDAWAAGAQGIAAIRSLWPGTA